MVRNFDQGDVYHIDAEGNSNETWIRQLNGYTPEEYEDKYHLLDEQYVDKLFTQVVQMCEMKINDKACYYDTGRYSERGEKIITPQPTVIIIDSLPSLQTTEVEDNTKLDTQTYNMRLAKAYGEFYKRLRPMIQKANITIIAINHIKEKPQMGFLTTQAKIQGCSPNESDIYVYRMTMVNEDGDVVEMSPDQVRYRCEQMGVKTVPVFERFIIPEKQVIYNDGHFAETESVNPGEYVLRKVEEYFDGPDPIGKTHIREGVVARIVNRPNIAVYKHKNFSFKVLEGIIKDEAAEPDMEEAQEAE